MADIQAPIVEVTVYTDRARINGGQRPSRGYSEHVPTLDGLPLLYKMILTERLAGANVRILGVDLCGIRYLSCWNRTWLNCKPAQGLKDDQCFVDDVTARSSNGLIRQESHGRKSGTGPQSYRGWL